MVSAAAQQNYLPSRFSPNKYALTQIFFICYDSRSFAKRFLHPSIVAPYDYVFLWDEDLGVENFTAEAYDPSMPIL